MKKTLIIIGTITVAILIILMSINSSNKARERREETAEWQRQVNIDNCIRSSYDLYTRDWNSACKLEGKGNDCSLPMFRKELLDAGRKDNEDRCVDRYSK